MATIARDLNLGESEKTTIQEIPQPYGDALKRRHVEPLDLVQEVMIERLARLSQRRFDIVEVQQHPGRGIRLAVDGDAGAERMSVDPGVGMGWRRRRQKVGGLEKEFLIDTHGAGLGDFVLLSQGR